MKKVCIMLMCICIILSGCQVLIKNDGGIKNAPSEEPSSSANDNKENNNPGSKDILEPGSNDTAADAGEAGLLRIDKEWSSVQSVKRNAVVLSVPGFDANVKSYRIAPNLSNIENIEQFSGFTDRQKKMLAENGFVVLPSRDAKMFYVYDSNEYEGIPNFITADSVLHLYHQFYDKSLAFVESDYLYEDLEQMTGQMLDHSIRLLEALKDETLKKLQEKNIIYFLVANMLMSDSPESVLSSAPEESLRAAAREEYSLIDKADGYQKSPLFGTDLDYSQFKVRGHYTRSEELGRFFRAMMWYGTAPLSFTSANGEFHYENTLQALLMTFTTFLENEEACSAELWSEIYKPTSQYVGLSDDIDVFTMNSLRLSVFGGDNDPNLFIDKAYYDKLAAAVKALPEPKIQGELTTVDTPTGRQFRFMGQRYILDGFIMQTLMKPILRPVPSGLDVMGVLGSDTAEELLFNHVKPQEQWPDYERKYRELVNEVSGYTDEIWGNNLYNGWLWSIREVLTEYGTSSGMPLFMTNEAWKRKSLNTALGSYAELKHDTVLYGKQPVAEAGGPVDFAEQHYVEPNIPLYTKLLYLTDRTISVLKESGMDDGNLLEGAGEYQTLLKLLIECSKKELRNEALTDDEKDNLLWYGGRMEYIINCFLASLSDEMSAAELSHMLVSDVATIAPGGYLSMGTGSFDHIYVIVPFEGKLYLSRGSVYSYYEFVSDTRLTDEEWWALNGLQKSGFDDYEYLEYTEPSVQLPKQPFWTESFKSDINHVSIEPLEVNWDELNE